MFAFVNGTIFGRAVVPDVCSTRAGSAGPAARSFRAEPAGASPSSRNTPAGSLSAWASVSIRMPRRLAMADAAGGPPGARMMAAGFRSDR